MKKIKVSILALSVLVGGAVLASAANVTVYTAYSISATETNPTASYWSISGVPSTVSGFPDFYDDSVYASTDSSGKIVGAGWYGIDFNTNYLPFTYFTTDVSGKVGMKGSSTVVTMNIKGTGYTASGDGTAEPTSFNLKFTGQPGPNPNTNSSQKLVILGTLSGTIKGTTPLGNKSAKINNLAAIIGPGSAYLNFLDFNVDVLQTLKSTGGGITGKQQIFGSMLTGTGNVKGGSFTANVKGVGPEKGQALTVTGNMGLYTNNIGTNPVVFTAPITVNITKGKVSGQSVSGLASHVDAHLIH